MNLPKRVGIDICSQHLRIVVTDSIERSVVTDIAEVPIIQNSGETAEQATTRSLKGFVSQRKLQGSEAIFSVPSDAAQYIWSTLPKCKAAELNEVARFRLRQRLPLGVNGTAVGAVSFGDIDDNQIEAFVIAAPMDIVAERARIVKRSDLIPVGAEVEPQALLRVVANDFGNKSALVKQLSMTVIEVGEHRTRFVVMQNQRLQFVRSVRFGSRKFCESLANESGYTVDQVAGAVRSGFAKINSDLKIELWIEDQSVQINARPAMESLFKELSRLITYFRSLKNDRSYTGLLERLVLTGLLVSIEGFAEVVNAQMGLRTHALDPFSGRNLVVNAEDLEHALTAPHRFTVAVGLAVSPYSLNLNNGGIEREQRSSLRNRAA